MKATDSLGTEAERYSEDAADGALEIVELLYASIPCYQAGWEFIHPQDQDEWLTSFRHLDRPWDLLAQWAAEGLLNRPQQERYLAIRGQRAHYEPFLARLTSQRRVPTERAPQDDYDLL